MPFGGARVYAPVPDVPTVAELGHPDFNVVSWIGAFLPASASDAAVQRLHGALAKALQNSTVRARMADIGVIRVGSSPQELGDFTKAEVKRWAEVIAKYKIQQD